MVMTKEVLLTNAAMMDQGEGIAGRARNDRRGEGIAGSRRGGYARNDGNKTRCARICFPQFV